MLPSKLKDMNLYAANRSFVHQIPELTPPKVTAKTEEYRGGGMLAPVDIEYGLEKMELEFTVAGLAVPILQQFGLIGVSAAVTRFVGGYQEESYGGWTAVEIVTRGKWTEFDPGTAKVGDDTEHKFKQTASYYRLDVNSATVFEIDILNNIYRVGGVDRLAELRSILGQ